ncbi:hypothetical protein HD554DRAFT_2165615 [Boletus coccyginus]|nr:hypothetical protein HD554DRAFT_2165615 [Boletus coccyginus]
MSFIAMWGAIGVPTNKAPINITTMVSYVLPPVLFYFITAVLAVTLHTRALRVALWPVVVLLVLRASFSVDMAPSNLGRKFHHDLACPMLLMVTRSLHFALEREPFVRRLRPVNSTPSTLMDAFDLAFTFRGCGWNWSRGLYIPPETRPPNRTKFISHVALSAAVHALLNGTLDRALRSFSPIGLGSVPGGSIFDDTTFPLAIPAIEHYLHLGVLVFRQDPAQWPPAFHAPWRATSLSEFWGRRWHQWLRHIFLVQAGHPLSFILGRVGLVIGAFLSSAVYHHIQFSSLDSTSEPWRMLLGFGMMAPGMFAEQTFKQLTGRKDDHFPVDYDADLPYCW